MEIELHKGDVFACKDPACGVELEVRKGGRCRSLACCGRKMVLIASEQENLDRYEEEMLSECDQDGG
jgi:hypothetical protein